MIKAAHLAWKLHLEAMLHKGVTLSLSEIPDHTQCEFGKWYYGNSSNAVRSFKEYAALESVHQYMHDNARELAILSKNDELIPVDAYHIFLERGLYGLPQAGCRPS